MKFLQYFSDPSEIKDRMNKLADSNINHGDLCEEHFSDAFLSSELGI
jgi:hypothetical protein